MGDASDDYAADDMFRMGMEDAERDNAARRQPTKTIWVTRDGQRIPVKRLGDGHLVNIIKYLLRNAEDARRAEVLGALHVAATMQGEMAIESVESAASDLGCMSNEEYLDQRVPTWDALLTEAMKRKLVARDAYGDLVFP